LTLARERLLPVDPVLAALLPDAGLVRGRVVGCAGDAAMSLALALAAGASAAGSWLAVVGPVAGGAGAIGPGMVGVEAAAELGVAVERLVVVDADPARPQEWAERVAATADGVELILTSLPVGAERVLRQVRQRVQARGAVLLVVGTVDTVGTVGTVGTVDTVGTVGGRAAAGVDVVVEARTVAWEGIGEGTGRLCRRRVEVVVAGRRTPRPVRGACWLPGTSGVIEPIRSIEHDDTAGIPVPVTVHAVELSRTG
jgi:hypothetical protein